MIIKYLLILGIGHLLGDFYFQTDKRMKYENRGLKDFFWHTLEYYIAFLMTVLPVFSADMVLAATYAAMAHSMIDIAEYLLFKKRKVKKDGKVLIIDQFIHIISLCVLAYIMERWNFVIGHFGFISYWLDTFDYSAEAVAKWLIAILFIHKPVNIFIQIFLGEYRPKTNGEIIKADSKAGRKIGTIERLIMLIFLSKDQFTALGFVLTAKSIARYDKIAKDEKFAEYYLLGTLVSTLSVIVIRVLILQ